MEESYNKTTQLTGIRMISDFLGSENGNSENECNSSGIGIDLSSTDNISDLSSPYHISDLSSLDHNYDLRSPGTENSSGIENDDFEKRNKFSFDLEGNTSLDNNVGAISCLIKSDSSNFASHATISALEPEDRPQKKPSITVTEVLLDGWKRLASKRMSGKSKDSRTGFSELVWQCKENKLLQTYFTSYLCVF